MIVLVLNHRLVSKDGVRVGRLVIVVVMQNSGLGMLVEILSVLVEKNDKLVMVLSDMWMILVVVVSIDSTMLVMNVGK